MMMIGITDDHVADPLAKTHSMIGETAAAVRVSPIMQERALRLWALVKPLKQAVTTDVVTVIVIERWSRRLMSRAGLAETEILMMTTMIMMIGETIGVVTGVMTDAMTGVTTRVLGVILMGMTVIRVEVEAVSLVETEKVRMQRELPKEKKHRVTQTASDPRQGTRNE
jgi:hypothetical protein